MGVPKKYISLPIGRELRFIPAQASVYPPGSPLEIISLVVIPHTHTLPWTDKQLRDRQLANLLGLVRTQTQHPGIAQTSWIST